MLKVALTIAYGALTRTESRGAHFREDYPKTGDLARSAFTRVQRAGAEADATAEDHFEVTWQAVAFTRVEPGQSLIAA